MNIVYKIIILVLLVLIGGCSQQMCDVTIISKNDEKKITKQRMAMPISLGTNEFSSIYVSNCD